MSGNRIEVEFGARTEELSAGAKKASEDIKGFGSAAQEAARSSTSAWGPIGSMFQGVGESIRESLSGTGTGAMGSFGQVASQVADNVSTKWGGLSAVFRGVGLAAGAAGLAIGAGVASKKIADGFAEDVEGAMDFARAMGSTTNVASVMQAALADVGASQEEYLGAAKGLSRQLRENEDDMKAMGLQTRDSAGNLRPLNELTLDAIETLKDYREGADRALAGQVLFGRGIDASSRLMLLNKDTIDANREAVAELGIEVGANAAAAWAEYDNASDRAGLTMTAFGRIIADAVMPVATQMTEWFNSIAPAAMTVLRGALNGLSSAFLGLANGVVIVWEAIKAMIYSVTEPLRSLGSAFGKLVTGDIKGATEEMMSMPARIGSAWASALDEMTAKSQQTRDRLARMWSGAMGPDSAPGDSGGTPGDRPGPQGKATTKPPKVLKQKEEHNLPMYEQMLEQERALAAEKDALHGLSKEREVQFWEEFLASAKLTNAEQIAVAKKYSAARVAMLQEQAQEAREIDKVSLGQWEQTALARIDLEQESARTRQQLGEITNAQLLQQEQQFEDRRAEIKMAALRAQLATLDPTRDVVQVAQINAQLEQAEMQHQMRLAQIRTQQAQESAREQSQVWRELSDTTAGLWDKGLQAMMNRSLTWQGATKAIGTAYAGWFAEAVVGEQVKSWIKGQTTKLAATMAGLTAEKSAQAAGSTAVMATKATEATAVVGANAAEAASGAAASQASIPWVGPVLAAAAFASIFAMVMGAKSSVKSARGGYDIPAGVSPLTQLHEQEMVLPAEHANTIRRLGRAGGGDSDPFASPADSASSQPVINVTVNHSIQALDGASVKRVLMANTDAVAASIRQAVRDGCLPSPGGRSA